MVARVSEKAADVFAYCHLILVSSSGRMEADELLKKIRVLEEGQEELKRGIGKLIPDRRGGGGGQSSSASPRRLFPALQQASSSSRGRALALFQIGRAHV